MEDLEKIVFVNKNGKMRLWTAEDEANRSQNIHYLAVCNGINSYKNIFYRHWDGSCWQPHECRLFEEAEDVDLCYQWVNVPIEYEKHSQYPIHIKDEDRVCYYAEIITDRDYLSCTLKIRCLDTHKGDFIKMSMLYDSLEVEFKEKYDLPDYNQIWYEIKFDIRECRVVKHRYESRNLIESLNHRISVFKDDRHDDDIDWMLRDHYTFYDDTQSEIENVLLEKIKELQDIAKKDPYNYINKRSKKDHKGYELAKLMTQYPEFFKD